MMLLQLLACALCTSLASGALKLVMEDTFGGADVDLSKWEHEVTLGGGGNWEFQAYTPDKKNSYIRSNTLFLKPTLTSDTFGEGFLTSGVWDMRAKYGKCTVSSWYGCKREGRHGTLNPVMSAKLKSTMSIKYGRVEVVAKLPRGDWIWPAIWMLPEFNKYGSWPRSGEIDICESRGNVNYGSLGVDYSSSTLHWGIDPGQNKYYKTTDKVKSTKTPTFADGFHTFVLDWDAAGITTYVDNQRVLRVNTPPQSYFNWGGFHGGNIWAGKGTDAPFNQDFYLILNVAVGGTNGYFSDNVRSNGKSKPWKNTSRVGPKDFWSKKHEWYPTWNGEDAAMQIKSVKMFQKQ